jgi:hypothetical protein
MATRKVTALATRKSTPVVSLAHQPITEPRHRQRACKYKLSKEDELVAVNIHTQRGEAVVDKVIAKKSSMITPEDELAVVALQISDVRDEGDAEELTDKTIASLESYPMN